MEMRGGRVGVYRRKHCCLASGNMRVKLRALAGCVHKEDTCLCPGGVAHRLLLTIFKVHVLKNSFNTDDEPELHYLPP